MIEQRTSLIIPAYNESMQSGYKIARSLGNTALLFLDADLRGITPTHVNSLIETVINEEVPMTIGILDRTKLQKVILKKWGALSGQRAKQSNMFSASAAYMKRYVPAVATYDHIELSNKSRRYHE